MTETTHGKIIVGSSINALNNAKIYGLLNLRNLYLLNIVGSLIVNTKNLDFQKQQILETLFNIIKYNDKNICNYRQKDLISFKKVTPIDQSINTLKLMVDNTLPTVDDAFNQTISDYIFREIDFTTNFTTVDDSVFQTVRISSLPTDGLISFDNVNIIAGFEFDLINISKLKYTLTNTTTPIVSTFNFQTSNNNINKLFSNMATFTLNIQAAINLPPSAVGDNAITIANAATRVFTIADFTTNTTPAYSDPEGDAAANLRVLTLPIDGVLEFNSVAVTVNQIIPFTGGTSITSGALRYVASQVNTAVDTETFTFEISDSGSNTFVA
jgi:hypothetical protein